MKQKINIYVKNYIYIKYIEIYNFIKEYSKQIYKVNIKCFLKNKYFAFIVNVNKII